jgi:hypothetical protein
VVILCIAAHADIKAARALHDFEHRLRIGENVPAAFVVGI